MTDFGFEKFDLMMIICLIKEIKIVVLDQGLWSYRIDNNRHSKERRVKRKFLRRKMKIYSIKSKINLQPLPVTEPKGKHN